MTLGGLDTLATLCGGVQKAYTEETATATATASTPTNDTQSLAASAQSTASTTPLAAPRNSPDVSVKSGDVRQQPQSFPPSTKADSSMQQWQALATAAAFGSFPNQAAFASMFQSGAPSPAAIQAPPIDPNTYMQQFAYYQYLAAVQAQQIAVQNTHNTVLQPPTQATGHGAISTFAVESNSSTPLLYHGHPLATHQIVPEETQRLAANQPMKQIQPSPPPQQPLLCPNQQTTPSISASTAKTAPTPLPPISPFHTPVSNGMMVVMPPVAPKIVGHTPNTILPLHKPTEAPIAQRPTSESSCIMHPTDGKKQLKRAANRRSAQLSRKRKKLYIEELKEENDELRRKEQILMSIPDLIVVFDSAGKLWFVSQSVYRFLDFIPEELVGSSFWNRLCEESVRLLKAAFMDALAARKNDMDTAPLGTGVWELRLIDKDGSPKVVTLNGVVHFTGEAPECVCSIRPRDINSTMYQSAASGQKVASVDFALGSIRAVIKPNQSVITKSGSVPGDSESQVKVVLRASGEDGRLISDGDSGSVVSESGSE